MAQSFTATGDGALADARAQRRRVLVTGAAGNIGSYFAEHSHDRYDLRLMVREQDDKEDVDAIRGFGEVVVASLDDLERMKEISTGIDTMLHLAANPDASATWDSILPD